MGGYQMHVGPSLLSADQKYPDPLQQQYPGGSYASLPPNANLSLVTGMIPVENPVGPAGGAGNPYYTSLLMLRPQSGGSPQTDPSTRKAVFLIIISPNSSAGLWKCLLKTLKNVKSLNDDLFSSEVPRSSLVKFLPKKEGTWLRK